MSGLITDQQWAERIDSRTTETAETVAVIAARQKQMADQISELSRIIQGSNGHSLLTRMALIETSPSSRRAIRSGR